MKSYLHKGKKEIVYLFSVSRCWLVVQVKCGKGNLKPNIFRPYFSDEGIIEEQKFW